MGCCGNSGPTSQLTTPLNVQQEGDILVAAMWGGNKEFAGRVTGRRYPRTGNGKPVWVNEADAKAEPRKFKAITLLSEPVTEEDPPPDA